LIEAIIEAAGMVKRFGKGEALAGLDLVACRGDNCRRPERQRRTRGAAPDVPFM